MRAVGKTFEDVARTLFQPLASRKQQQWIEIPLDRHVAGQFAGGPCGIDRLVHADRLHARLAGIGGQFLACTLGKSDDRRCGVTFAQGRDDSRIGRNHQTLEFIGGQASCPAVEQLDRFGTRLDLAGEIADRLAGDGFENGVELGRVAIGHRARLVLVAAAFARRHIGRHRPRASRKAKHGHLIGQPLAA